MPSGTAAAGPPRAWGPSSTTAARAWCGSNTKRPRTGEFYEDIATICHEQVCDSIFRRGQGIETYQAVVANSDRPPKKLRS